MTDFIALMKRALLDAVIRAGRPSSAHGLDHVHYVLAERVRREVGL